MRRVKNDGASRRTARSGRKRGPRGLLPFVLASLVAGGASRAQTLDEAANSALFNSFTLRAEQARLDGAEARLRGSIDQFMPTIGILVDKPLNSRITYSPEPLPTTLGFGVDDIPRSAAARYGIGVDLPLFDGFKRWNDFQSSRLLAEAGRLLVAGTKQQVLLDTAVAYLAVLRDTRIVALRKAQVAANDRILKSTQVQFAVSDATRTDVALARSRVQDALTSLERAESDLVSTRLEFTRMTRLDPDRLAPPVIPNRLPATQDGFIGLVRSANPKLAAARLGVSSAGYQAEAAQAALSPQVSLQFSRYSQIGYSPALDRINETTTRILARIPIYEPGTLPRISEASALARQRDFETQDAELQLLTAAKSAYGRRASALAQVRSAAERVKALQATVRGMEIERGAGFRTVLDELNLRAELAQAEVVSTSLSTERDVLLLNLAAVANLLDDRLLPTRAAAPPRVAQPGRDEARRELERIGVAAIVPPKRPFGPAAAPLRTGDPGIAIRGTLVSANATPPPAADPNGWRLRRPIVSSAEPIPLSVLDGTLRGSDVRSF